eukprot:2393415-Amphidinium_carterae.2
MLLPANIAPDRTTGCRVYALWHISASALQYPIGHDFVARDSVLHLTLGGVSAPGVVRVRRFVRLCGCLVPGRPKVPIYWWPGVPRHGA